MKNARAIQLAESIPHMPAALIARLTALGGVLLTTEPSRFGSYEVLTPLGAEYKLMWCTPGALEGLLDEWEAAGVCGERMAAWIGRMAARHE